VYLEFGSITQVKMTAKVAARTSTGRVRNSNEDAFGYRPEHGIYVVCDGMGGAAGGEIASRMAVDTVLGRLSAEGDPRPGREKLHEAIAEANRVVLEPGFDCACRGQPLLFVARGRAKADDTGPLFSR